MVEDSNIAQDPIEFTNDGLLLILNFHLIILFNDLLQNKRTDTAKILAVFVGVHHLEHPNDNVRIDDRVPTLIVHHN